MSDRIVECMQTGDISSLRDYIASLDSINDYVYNDDDNNLNLLQLAAGLDTPYRNDIIEALFKMDADPNYPGRSERIDNIRAIHLTAMWGYDTTLKLLLLHGADVSLRDSNNWSPVDYASIFDNYVCISLLLRYGSINASPNAWSELIQSSFEENADSSIEKIILNPLKRASINDNNISSCCNDDANRSESPQCQYKSYESENTEDDQDDDANSSWDRINEADLNLSIADVRLRQELKHHGQNPGPITDTTRRLYIKLLYLLKKRQSQSYTPRTVKKAELNGYSVELNSIVTGKFSSKQALELERELLRVSSSRDYHGPKQFFNYILIDPRISRNLPEQAMEASDSDTSVQFSSQNKDPSRVMQKVTRKFNEKLFIKFIESIFYIGKGQKKRDLMHLFDAIADRESITKKKIETIREIWSQGYGVVSLHLFHNITSKEALTREALMIETIGLDNLTNILKGTVPFRLGWNDYRRKLVGALLLHRAYTQLLNEGERQIRRQDLKV